MCIRKLLGIIFCLMYTTVLPSNDDIVIDEGYIEELTLCVIDAEITYLGLRHTVHTMETEDAEEEHALWLEQIKCMAHFFERPQRWRELTEKFGEHAPISKLTYALAEEEGLSTMHELVQYLSETYSKLSRVLSDGVQSSELHTIYQDCTQYRSRLNIVVTALVGSGKRHPEGSLAMMAHGDKVEERVHEQLRMRIPIERRLDLLMALQKSCRLMTSDIERRTWYLCGLTEEEMLTERTPETNIHS